MNFFIVDLLAQILVHLHRNWNRLWAHYKSLKFCYLESAEIGKDGQARVRVFPVRWREIFGVEIPHGDLLRG